MFTASVLVCAFLASASDERQTGPYAASTDVPMPDLASLGNTEATPTASTPKGTPKAALPADKVTLVSYKDMTTPDQKFEVDAAKIMKPDGITCQSSVIGTMLADMGTEEELPLLNVKAPILAKVIKYMDHHHDKTAEEVQKPLKSVNLKECGVSDWDADYVDIEQEVLFELILAANYLDIKELLDLTCAKVASMIKGKTPEEIRKQFNIVNDFTPEEEKQIAEENQWCKDD